MVLKVIIEQDEDGYFVAECPALPGCVSQGKTSEEAEANIREAIEGWLLVANERVKIDRPGAHLVEIRIP